MQDLSAAKKAVIDREIFCLLEKGLASNLMSFVAKLLGPEGIRQATPSSAAHSAQVGQAGEGTTYCTAVVGAGRLKGGECTTLGEHVHAITIRCMGRLC